MWKKKTIVLNCKSSLLCLTQFSVEHVTIKHEEPLKDKKKDTNKKGSRFSLSYCCAEEIKPSKENWYKMCHFLPLTLKVQNDTETPNHFSTL